MDSLRIDPEFRDKIPPLTADEFQRLEENILADGVVLEPLIVWNDTIIDGHHRWAIIQKHPEIPYSIKRMDFADRWAAIAWMCGNQLGRRNISDEQKTYLLGKLYEARKNTTGGDRKSGEISKVPKGPLKNYHGTRSEVAKEQGVSEKVVFNATNFARGLDAAEEVSEGFREKVLSGEVKAPKSAIAELRNLDGDELKEAVEELKKPKEERKPKCSTKADIAEIEKSIAERRDVSHESAYTIDDLIEEIATIRENFTSRIRRVISIRQKLVEDNAAKVHEELEKVINEIEQMEDGL